MSGPLPATSATLRKIVHRGAFDLELQQILVLRGIEGLDQIAAQRRLPSEFRLPEPEGHDLAAVLRDCRRSWHAAAIVAAGNGGIT